MNKRATIAALVAAISVAMFTRPPSAAADDPSCGPLSQQTCWDLENGKVAGGREIVERQAGRAGQHGVSSKSATQALRDAMTAAFCQDANANVAASGGATAEVAALCHGFAALVVAPSREQVLRAFEELPLYRGAIRTDPGVFTLVNLETFFWCADTAGRGCDVLGEGERTVTLLGQAVRIRPRIVDYRWEFGDGAGQSVAAGRAAHTYAHAGTAEISLTLTWTADYSVGNGTFAPIGGTTTTTSPARELPVREAEAVIVGDR